MNSELQPGSQLPAQACLVSLTLIGDTDIYLGVEQSDPVTSVLEMHLGPEVTGRAHGSLGRVMTPLPQLAGHVSRHSPRQKGKLATHQVPNDSYSGTKSIRDEAPPTPDIPSSATNGCY